MSVNVRVCCEPRVVKELCNDTVLKGRVVWGRSKCVLSVKVSERGDISTCDRRNGTD